MSISSYIDYENDRILEEKTNYYIDVKYIDQIIKKEIGKDINELKKHINSLNINICEEEIIDYLYMKLYEQNFEDDYLNKFNDLKKFNGYYKFLYLRELLSNNVIRSYVYDPYSFEYLNKYISILKNKILKFIYIIENINKNNINLVNETLDDLDIDINEGMILFTDVVRLVVPLKFNLDELKSKIEQINSLDTYLYLKKSDDIFLGFDYPKESLQYNSNLYCSGYIPLTENQKNKLNERNNKILSKNIMLL